MKRQTAIRIITLLAVCALSVAGVVYPTSAQDVNLHGWATRSSSSTTLLEVAFVDGRVGWAVGTGGAILSTADGGATWTPQESGTTFPLHSVSFVDSSTGVGRG